MPSCDGHQFDSCILADSCGLPTEELIPLAESLLEAPADLITSALDLERSEGAVVADRVGETDCVFLARVEGVGALGELNSRPGGPRVSPSILLYPAGEGAEFGWGAEAASRNACGAPLLKM